MLASLLSAALLALGMSAIAGEFVPGQHDAEALQLLQSMSDSIPLHRTQLVQAVPEYVVAKDASLTWEQAVAEADARFGKRQPQRAAFLRKYLSAGSLESQFADLQLPNPFVNAITGGGTCKRFLFSPQVDPLDWITITVWVAKGQLISPPTLTFAHGRIGSIDYRDLWFDLEDRLISASWSTKSKTDGSTISIGENTSGEGGVNYYYAEISRESGEGELISYSPDLVIKARTVFNRIGTAYREVYEDGKLKKRAP